MQKALCFLLLILCLPAVASADTDVLANGWWNATLEELIDAREQIDFQIEALGGEIPAEDDDVAPAATFTPEPAHTPLISVPKIPNRKSTAAATAAPTATPTPEPTKAPTPEPTKAPTPEPTVYNALSVGSEGQEVLDARMRLYALGYFQNKPTQTTFTKNMADYVKEFEADFGLPVDGDLSPEDLQVLYNALTPPVEVAVSAVGARLKGESEVISAASVTISWEGVSSAAQYTVYRSASRNGEYANIGTTDAVSYVDNDVKDGETYYYKIEASNAYATSALSQASEKVTIPEPEHVYTSPLQMTDARMRFNSIGSPLIYVSVKNSSKDVTVNAFTFETKCYDAYGNLLKSHGFGDTTAAWIWQEGTIKPGKTWTSNNWRWTLSGYDTAYEVHVYLTSVHTTDGRTIRVPKDEQKVFICYR